MFKTWVISIPGPSATRLDPLAARLRENAVSFDIVPGVDGKLLAASTYFELAKPYYEETNRFMTPSEVGCALSHLAAWKAIASGNEPFGVVLEDDALIDSSYSQRLGSLLACREICDFFVSLGGHEDNIPAVRKLRGRPLANLQDIWEVCPADFTSLFGAVGYLIHKRLAERLAEMGTKRLSIVDDYARHYRNGVLKRVALTNIVGHPWGNYHSHILGESRSLLTTRQMYHNPLAKRIVTEIKRTIQTRQARRRDIQENSEFSPIPWVSHFRQPD